MILALIILFKLCDALAGAMTAPFVLVGSATTRPPTPPSSKASDWRRY